MPREDQDHTWLSAHLFFDDPIYLATADRVIVEVVAPLARECLDRDWIRRFFFIRYSDEGPHVRLRLYGRPEVLDEQVRPRLVECAEADASAGSGSPVSRLAWVPYEPEVERYGGPHGVVLAEQLFHDSSETAIGLLRKIEPGDRPARLGKALLAMLVLLHTFLATRAPSARLADTYGRNYLRALAPDPDRQAAWLRAFEQGHDRQADKLAAYLEVAWEALEGGEELTDELAWYRQRLEAVRERFRSLVAAGGLLRGATVLQDWQESVGAIVPSYLHMMNNRLGVTVQEESYLSVLINLTLGRTVDDATT